MTAADVSQTIRLIQQENSGAREQLCGSEQGIVVLSPWQKTAREAADYPITTSYSRGAFIVISLADVARVVDTCAVPLTALLDGKPSIGFQVIQAKGFDETELATLNVDARQLDIRVMLPQELRADAIWGLRVHSNAGLVPLDSVADITL